LAGRTKAHGKGANCEGLDGILPALSPKSLADRLAGFEHGISNNRRVTNRDGAITVFTERRKQTRRRINRVAQFYGELGELPRPCMVTDISDSGARLYCDVAMPPKFVLAVSGEGGSLRHECRVVWQLGGELGVEFVDSAR
jgi:hypothetical protein